jgi:hypothetical protein
VAELPGDVLGRLAFVDEQRCKAGSQIAGANPLRAVLVAGGEASRAGGWAEGAIAPVVPVVVRPRLSAAFGITGAPSGGSPEADLHVARSPASTSSRRVARSTGTPHDPTGEKARAVKARYRGVCRGCGADTQPRNGKGDAYEYCKACHPGAIQVLWTCDRVLDAMLAWRARYGRLPSSYDWSRTQARRRGGRALERLSEGQWPPASVVSDHYGTWAAARAAARRDVDAGRGEVDLSAQV